METNKINNSTVKPTRRKFLTRTAAGVVVASIPARSVLANNIVNSIVASVMPLIFQEESLLN